MQTWIRVTLLMLCTATGIGVALAVALRTPGERPRHPKIAAVAQPPQNDGPPRTTAPLPPANVGAQPGGTPAAESAPIVAPYRDPVARQVGRLEESLQELEESSHRRERSLMRAIAAIQNQVDDAPRRPAAADD